jgi:Fe-S-cluster containining protein
MNAPVNPCLDCPDLCCALQGACGLRLSQEEYQRFFQAYQEVLDVRQEDGVVILSARPGRGCPNLGDKGCRIYDERPIDCRLYPYQVAPLYQTRRRVVLMLYRQPVCVADKDFSFLADRTPELAAAFGRRAFPGKQVRVRIFNDSFIAKARNKLERWLMTGLHRLRML